MRQAFWRLSKPIRLTSDIKEYCSEPWKQNHCKNKITYFYAVMLSARQPVLLQMHRHYLTMAVKLWPKFLATQACKLVPVIWHLHSKFEVLTSEGRVWPDMFTGLSVMTWTLKINCIFNLRTTNTKVDLWCNVYLFSFTAYVSHLS